MTNYDRIMQLTADGGGAARWEPPREEAKLYNDAGRWLDWTDAIQAEIEWLKKEDDA